MHATPPLTNVFGFVVAFLYFLLIWIDIGVSACFVYFLFLFYFFSFASDEEF